MADRAVYGAGFAALYDLFYESKDYVAEARFIRRATDDVFRGSGQPRLLDLACGTGSHAVALANIGFDVTGIDGSPEMLRVARGKAAARGLPLRLERQDLADLHLPAAQWDVVTCLFDSLGYLRTDARISKALRMIRRAVRPGGFVIVEVWHAAAMLKGFEPVRVRRVRRGRTEATRISETRMLRRSLAEVRYEFFCREAPQPWRRFTETHVNRFFTSREIVELLTAASLDVVQLRGGYDASKPATDKWHLVAVARRDRKSR